jgi:hypothetical protein
VKSQEGSKHVALMAQCALPERTILGKRVLLAHTTRIAPKGPFSLAPSVRHLVILLDVEPYGPAVRSARSSAG